MTQLIAVLGLGNWGTALAHHLGCKGVDVLGIARESEIVNGINGSHRNPLYFADVPLSPRVRATSSIDECAGCAAVVYALPSSALGEVLPRVPIAPGALFVSAVKGLEWKSRLTPLQFAAGVMPQGTPLAVISGPSFALDVVQQRPCGVVAAARDEETARRAADLFTSDSMRVYVSTDPVGVELGGILKNVIALAVGVCDGMRLGDSARAGLITRGLAEITRVATALGADPRTLTGLSGLGDLAMTASSDLSRNRTVGLRLGRGEKLSDIVASLGSVAEGVMTARLAVDLAAANGVEMPISEAVVSLLDDSVTPEAMVKRLLTRPTKRETH